MGIATVRVEKNALICKECHETLLAHLHGPAAHYVHVVLAHYREKHGEHK